MLERLGSIAVEAHPGGAPVTRAGEPGHLVPRYFPRIVPTSTTTGINTA
jgi:hypothetical protein